MKLVEVQVQNFRNIIDSSVVEVDPSVTCLVGKNESGKTAFLEALRRIKPESNNVSFNVQEQYPAWLEKRDRKSGIKIDEFRPIRVKFELSESEVQNIEGQFGKAVLENRYVELEKSYDGHLYYTISVKEKSFVTHVVNNIEFPRGTKTKAKEAKSIEYLKTYVDQLAKEKDEEKQQLAEDLQTFIKEINNHDDLKKSVWAIVKKFIPKFLYFSEYSRLPYSVDIERVLTGNSSDLEDWELTARSLLRLGGADDEYLTNPDYELRKRELENVSNALSRDVKKYWSQNADLRMQPDISQKTITVEPNKGKKAVVDQLKLRIWDDKHMLSLPFDEHSSGFRWFFSFLAAFSQYENTAEPLVILLDEPALGLHAKAQDDFLRYIEERLATRCQVIYTTHSPFMVQPSKLERVRLVEDKTEQGDPEPKGASISSDVTSTDPDTLFPLQGALGYDLVQHLLIGPHNLIVEGTSDYTYLMVISDYLRDNDNERSHLDERWSIIPVGGADMIPTFAALLGNKLDVTILVDAQKKGHQKLSQLKNQGILSENRVITVGSVLDRKVADIEDIFEEKDYLNLYNLAFDSIITEDDLKGNDTIVKKIARHEGVDDFNHGKPADILLRKRDEILPKLSSETLNHFSELFEKINSTLN